MNLDSYGNFEFDIPIELIPTGIFQINFIAMDSVAPTPTAFNRIGQPTAWLYTGQNIFNSIDMVDHSILQTGIPVGFLQNPLFDLHVWQAGNQIEFEFQMLVINLNYGLYSEKENGLYIQEESEIDYLLNENEIKEYEELQSELYNIEFYTTNQGFDVHFISYNNIANPLETIIWTIDAPKGVKISQNGLLTVPEDTSINSRIVVKASSALNPAIYDTIELIVENQTQILRTSFLPSFNSNNIQPNRILRAGYQTTVLRPMQIDGHNWTGWRVYDESQTVNAQIQNPIGTINIGSSSYYVYSFIVPYNDVDIIGIFELIEFSIIIQNYINGEYYNSSIYKKAIPGTTINNIAIPAPLPNLAFIAWNYIGLDRNMQYNIEQADIISDAFPGFDLPSNDVILTAHWLRFIPIQVNSPGNIIGNFRINSVIPGQVLELYAYIPNNHILYWYINDIRKNATIRNNRSYINVDSEIYHYINIRIDAIYLNNTPPNNNEYIQIPEGESIIMQPQFPIGQLQPNQPPQQAPQFILQLPFIDVSQNSWYFNYILTVFSNNLFEGTSINMFNPNLNMSRAMFVQALFNLYNELGINSNNSNNINFIDVNYNSWYFESINWAANNAIILGNTDGIFEPDRYITREEIALILYRFIQSFEIKLYSQYYQNSEIIEFLDFEYISNWAIESVLFLKQFEIFIGDPDSLFNPTKAATRAEVTAIFARILDIII